MIDVFVFLTTRSMRNRFLRRLRRLREPRYLVPTAVSVLWIGFWMSNMFLRGGSRPPDMFEAFAGADTQAALAALAATALFVWAAVLWLVPSEGALLEFTPAEIHLLFPAPVTRRQIVHYKLLRAQLGILFGALITSFFWGGGLFRPEGPARLAGFWLLYATLHLHSLGAGFVRTNLIEQGVSGLRRRIVPLVLVLVVVAGAVIGLVQAWPVLIEAFANITASEDGRWTKRGFTDFIVALGKVGTTGVLGSFLAPFAVFPRLVMANGAGEFLRWFAPGLAILLAHYLWVVRSDAAFEEAAVEAAQKRAARLAATRDTARRGGLLSGSVRAFPWKLSPRGRPFVAIVWKNLVSLTRVTPVRALIVLGAFLFAALAWTMGRSDGAPLTLIVAILLVLVALFTGLFGPLFVRNDLREDLFHVDAVKTFPLSGKAIVFGELLAPWLVLAGLQALLLGGALIAFAVAGAGSLVQLGFEDLAGVEAWYGAAFAAAMLVLPAVTMAQLALQNALVLLFPAWVAMGGGRARGFEASGQRMLTMFGSAVVLTVCTLPAALSGGVAAWLLGPALGPAAIVVGAGIAAAWIVGEVVFATRYLGRLLDRLDPSTAGIEAQED